MDTLFEIEAANCPECGRPLEEGICRWCCDYCEPRTHARKTDPQTSHDAAARLKTSSHKFQLLKAYANADVTDEEAAVVAGLTHTGYWKRCADLRLGGYIEDTGLTRTGSSGMQQMVCRITNRGIATLTAAKEADVPESTTDLVPAPQYYVTTCMSCGGHNSVHYADCEALDEGTRLVTINPECEICGGNGWHTPNCPGWEGP